MTQNIKVSILMLTYNQEKYIARAIKSVIRQKTSFGIQLVIGDDCSTDNTQSICLQYKSKYPHLITLSLNERNLGLQQNFIKTYSLCTGQYIAICEGDDYWISRKKLQIQTEIMDTHPEYSCCFHRVINYFEEDGSKSLSNGGQKVLTDIIDLAGSNYISNVSSLFRRGLFGELPSWFTQVSTYDYAIHLLNAQYGKIFYLKKPMAVYRQHKKAIWSEAGIEKKLGIALSIRSTLMDYFNENDEVYAELRKAYTDISLSLLRHYNEINNEEQTEIIRKQILRLNSSWTSETLREREKTGPLSLTEKLKRYGFLFLKETRKEISKLIPLP